MPIEYAISDRLDLLYARYTGRISLPMLRDIYTRYLGDPNYRLGRPELIDMSGVTELDLDFTQMQSAMANVSRALPADPPVTATVILAPGDVPYGMARMYQSLSDISGVLDVSVHRSEQEALEALTLPYSDIDCLRKSGSFGPMRQGIAD